MTEVANTNSPRCEDLEELVTLALDEARRLGADQAEAASSRDTGLSVTARLGDVENIEHTSDRGLSVTVYKDACKGSASTTDISATAIREAAAKACSIAGLTAADPHAGLADADLMAVDLVDLDLDHPWALDADQAIGLAVECEAAALEVDKRINNSEGATVWTGRGSRAYGNTHGFIGSFSSSNHGISCAVIAEAEDVMQRDYEYTASRLAGELESPAKIGGRAAEKTLGRIGARKIKTTNAPVIFIPSLARGFIGHAISAVAGSAQYRRSTFLLDAVGETIFPEFMQIQERPHIRRAMASRVYDGEGVATYDRDIVSDGVLRGYLLNSYSARRLGLETTANAGGAQNLIVPGSDTDLAGLIKTMGTGLVVEELIGQGVNSVTGDYSRGAVGHWVENGEVQHAVHEVTIAGNLRDLYKRIAVIGNDQDLRGGIRCGSVLVEEMTIAGA